MRIGIQTWGSTGDVRPFVALAAALTRAGHQVHLVVTDIDQRDYRHYAEEYGFRITQVATPVIADAAQLHEIGRRCIEARTPAAQGRIIYRETFLPVVEAMAVEAAQLVASNEILVGHFFLHFLRAMAEKAGKPYVTVALAPFLLPSRLVYPSGAPRLGAWFNPLWWTLAGMVINRLFLGDSNVWRARLDLPPKRDQLREIFLGADLDLIASSPQLFPAPADWPASYRQCGFFDLPEDSRGDPIPAEVANFIAASAAPLFITFGSLMPMDAATLKAHLAIFTAALRLTGRRAIVQLPARWSGALPQSDHILMVRFISHRRVFPRCAMIVHHGGAGTTHTAMRAGVPSIVIPHLADQFFWGERLFQLGAAPRPIPLRKLNAQRLATAIEVVSASSAMRERARGLSEVMRKENGVGEAVALIENLRAVQAGKTADSSAASCSI